MTDAAQIAKALTPAQRKALARIAQCGSGAITRHGNVMCQGERMSTDPSTWLRLVAKELVYGDDGRIAVTDLGRAVAAELEG